MKFKINYFYILVICILITVNGEVSIVNDAIFPIMGTMVSMLGISAPLGPFLIGGLGMLKLCCTILSSPNNSPASNNTQVKNPLTQVDLLKSQAVILESIKTLDMHVLEESERIIRELTLTIETHDFFEKMRNSLEYFRRMYVDKFDVILNPNVTGTEKNLTMNDMLHYDSHYRNNLRSFINEYIKPNGFDPASNTVSLFFDYLLEKERLLAIKEDDCHSESLHFKVFKPFMYIAKILTEGYVMTVSAHVIQYQQEMQTGSFSDADATKNIAEKLVIDYKNDMKSLMEKTKWALENASRDIRNCGIFELKQGETFERVPLTQTIPVIYNMVETDVFEYKCNTSESFLKFEDYEVGECDGHTDIVPINSQLSIVVDAEERNRPYKYMKFTTPDGKEEVFGHNSTEFLAVTQSTKTFEQCYTVFCPAVKINAFAFSKQRVSAKPGNVITGLRLRVRKNVLYIDIQEGKFVDAISVDPKTVVWTETPESEHVIYMNSLRSKIVLGDFELKNNTFMTSIQLKNSNELKGFIKVFIEGSSPPNWNTADNALHVKVPETNELKLSEADDPERDDNRLHKLISKAPVKGELYYVNLQPSDFRKDFGRTTIPFLDIREVQTNPPAPISGVGLYHEAIPGSGGLIGLKLISPRLTDLVDFKQINDVVKEN